MTHAHVSCYAFITIGHLAGEGAETACVGESVSRVAFCAGGVVAACFAVGYSDEAAVDGADSADGVVGGVAGATDAWSNAVVAVDICADRVAG